MSLRRLQVHVRREACHSVVRPELLLPMWQHRSCPVFHWPRPQRGQIIPSCSRQWKSYTSEKSDTVFLVKSFLPVFFLYRWIYWMLFYIKFVEYGGLISFSFHYLKGRCSVSVHKQLTSTCLKTILCEKKDPLYKKSVIDRSIYKHQVHYLTFVKQLETEICTFHIKNTMKSLYAFAFSQWPVYIGGDFFFFSC